MCDAGSANPGGIQGEAVVQGSQSVGVHGGLILNVQSPGKSGKGPGWSRNPMGEKSGKLAPGRFSERIESWWKISGASGAHPAVRVGV